MTDPQFRPLADNEALVKADRVRPDGWEFADPYLYRVVRRGEPRTETVHLSLDHIGRRCAEHDGQVIEQIGRHRGDKQPWHRHTGQSRHYGDTATLLVDAEAALKTIDPDA